MEPYFTSVEKQIRGEKLYEEGNYEKAAEYFEQIARPGNEAQEWLLKCKRALGDKHDPTSAENIILGQKLYKDGSYEKAAKWFRKAADQGDDSAQEWLLNCYRALGNKLYKDGSYEKAAKWFRKAADQGDDSAQEWLLNCYRALGVKHFNDDRKYSAAKWYRKVANQGDDRAKFMLARCYLEGGDWPVPFLPRVLDKLYEIKFLKPFFKQWVDNIDQQINTPDGKTYRRYEGCTIERKTVADTLFRQVVNKLRKRAVEGDEQAAKTLEKGPKQYRPTIKNTAAERKRTLKAAKQGNAQAQFALGKTFLDDSQMEEAVKWLRKAAEQENILAYKFGLLCLELNSRS